MDKKYWEILDFSSVTAQIHIQGKDRFKTKFGASMSLLSLMIVVVLTGYFFISYLENREINVLGVTETKEFVASMDLNYKPFFFKLKYINGSMIDPSIAQVTVKYFLYDHGVYTSTDLQIENCEWDTHLSRDRYENKLKNVDLESFMCLKQDRALNLTFDPFQLQKNYFNIYLHPCSNLTSNNTCKGQDRINEVLSKSIIYFIYYFPNFNIDHYNSAQPLQEIVSYFEKKLYFNMFYRYIEYFKIANYTSDEGPVLEDLRTWTGYGRDPFTSNVEIGLTGVTSVPNSFSVFTININENSIDKYKRTYPKLQSLLANIGGVIKFIMTISRVITFYITTQMLNVELSNYFISDDPPKSDVKKSLSFNKNSIIDIGFNQINNQSNNYNNHSNNESNNCNNNCKIQENSFDYTLNQNTIPQILKINVKKPNNLKSNKNKRKISIIEAILPLCMLKSSSYKQKLYEYEYIIKWRLSLDEILNLFKEFENFKDLILDEEQHHKLCRMQNKSLSEYLKKIKENSFYENLKGSAK